MLYIYTFWPNSLLFKVLKTDFIIQYFQCHAGPLVCFARGKSSVLITVVDTSKRRSWPVPAETALLTHRRDTLQDALACSASTCRTRPSGRAPSLPGLGWFPPCVPAPARWRCSATDERPCWRRPAEGVFLRCTALNNFTQKSSAKTAALNSSA